MHSVRSGDSSWRPVLPLIGAGLLFCLFFTLFAPAAIPLSAQGEFIRVPGDAGSIQEAIDLVPAGGEIRVQGGGYFEHLVISKTLRLSGSWTGDFSTQDRNSPTILNGGGSGRAVTIGGGEVGTSVVISYFVFTGGDATGLGGVVTPTVPRMEGPDVLMTTLPRTVGPDTRTLDEQTAVLAGQLLDLAARGLFPGGQAALDALLQRVDAATTAATAAAPAQDTASTLSPAAADDEGEIDCGGGIYVNGAALHLIHATLEENSAGNVNGAGGGLCAVNIPADGLLLESVVIGRNLAANTGVGFGGGLFFDGGETPTAAALHLANVRLSANAASVAGRGYGGGAFVANAPAAQMDLAMFSGNYASRQGLYGIGGGLYLGDSSDVVMSRVGFEVNTGVNVSYYTGDEWPIGAGGAMYVYESPNLLITSPQNGDENSLLIGNLAALRGAGTGGALAVENSPGLQIERTRFVGNWALVYPSGGGDAASGGAIGLVGSPGFRLSGSHFANNIVAVFNLDGNRLQGGALAVNGADDVAITGNRFENNSCGTSNDGGLGHGGAVGVYAGDFITITGNTFVDNAADLGLSGGLGGALHLELTDDVLVEHNRFERNRGGAGAGIGGALTIEGNAAAVAPQGITDKLNERVAIRANTFSANYAAVEQGGDQANLGGAVALNSVNGVEFANNVLAGNVARDGGALALLGWDSATISATVAAAGLVNNTIFNNGGESGIYLEGWTTPITLTNNIVISHTVGIQIAGNQKSGGMAAEARYTLYNDNADDVQVDSESTLTETGKITGSVLFVEPWQGDFRLLPSSAAVDAGDPAGVPPAPAMDMEGTLRPFGVRVDVGAFEWHGPLHYTYLPGVLKEACKTQPVEGWAMGEEAQNRTTILHTVDGGLTWQRQYTATLLLNGLAIGDRLHLWSTGDSATILHSADGGATWQQQSPPAALPATASIGRITAVDANTAWAAAQSGGGENKTAHVLNTTDGGATWTVQTSFATGPGWINWIDAAGPNNIWASGGTSPALLGQGTGAGGNGYIYHSADGGRTWRLEFETPNGPVIGIDAVSATVAWAAGRFGAYRTLDGGKTWEFFNLVALADLNHVDSIGGRQVWVSGDSFTVLYTDQGLAQPLPNSAWQNRTPAPLQNKVAYTVDFIDANNGWIAGGAFGADPSGVIARTCDGGINWEVSQWQDLDTIRSVQMVPP